MTYSPVSVDTFGGFDRRSDPTEAGLSVAVDGTNFDLDYRGRIGPRMGITNIAAETTGTFPFAMAYYESAVGSPFVVTGFDTGSTIPVSFTGGTDGATLAAIPFSNNSFTRYGTPTAQRLYMVTSAGALHHLTALAWTGPLTVPSSFTPKHAAVYPSENRLILAGGSRVHFSDPDSHTFDALNYLDLTPGDGEEIKAVTPWRDLVFVFKESKFFVFTGTTIDSAGGPIFNYRTVNTGQGVTPLGGACAGDEGVFFLNSDGVYLTSGDAAVRVSDALGQQAGGDLVIGTLSVPVYWESRLYIFLGGLAGAMLVFDPKINMWTYWDVAINCLCALPEDLGLVAGGLNERVVKFTVSAATDNEDPIEWDYTSAMSDLNAPDRKVIRETSVWGQGDVTFAIGVDGGAAGTGVDMGSTPFGEMVDRTAHRGTYFSYKLSGTKGESQTLVNRIVFRVRDQEDPK